MEEKWYSTQRAKQLQEAAADETEASVEQKTTLPPVRANASTSPPKPQSASKDEARTTEDAPAAAEAPATAEAAKEVADA